MLSITSKKAREIARVPAELAALDKRIKAEAQKGEPGVWLRITDSAKDVLREKGFETTEDSMQHPGKTWIWWGN